MSKVFEIELGGQARRLRYDWASARPFFKAHGKRPWRFLFVDCMGYVLDDDGNMVFVEEKAEDGTVKRVPKSRSDLIDTEAQCDLIMLGIGKTMTADQADKFISQGIAEGKFTLGDLVGVAVKAALYAGVTGKSVDLDAAPKEEETEPGKAEAEP